MVVALVDKRIPLRRTLNQTLLLAFFLCQLSLDRFDFTLERHYLGLSLIKLLLLGLYVLLLHSQLVLLAFDIVFFALGVLKIAFEGPFAQAHAHVWQVKQVFDVGPLRWLDLEHPLDDAVELF